MQRRFIFLVVLYSIAFVLNLVWEFSHAHLYTPCPTIASCWPILLRASAWDALFVTALDFFWLQERSVANYTYVVIIALAAAIAIEWHALAIGRWAYTAAMPIIPLLHVGLSPVLQLPITAIITYEIARRLNAWRPTG